MKIEQIQQFYNERIAKNELTLSSIKQKIHLAGTLRLCIVVVISILAYFLWNQWLAVSGCIIGGIFPFIYLIKKHNKLSFRKIYLETAIKSDKNELKSIDYDFSAYDGAPEKINGSHFFSTDIDLFGKKSLFQSINRTVTVSGKNILADKFENPLNKKHHIETIQKAVQELCKQPDLLHHFRVTGLIYPDNQNDVDEIKKFSTQQDYVQNKKLWKVIAYIFPVFWIIYIGLAIAGIISASSSILLFFIFYGISLGLAKKIKILHGTLAKKVNILSSYSKLFELIEKNPVEAENLKAIKEKLKIKQKYASQSIHRLSKLVNDLDQRDGWPACIFLNAFLLWEIKYAIKIEDWKNEDGQYLDNWLKALGEFDALCSLSSFSFNHPDYIFPEITDEYFSLQAEQLGHPLMNRNTCVKNNIDIEKNPFFLIITGANMAGKSTYLRTVSVNYLLACVGAPVCAGKFTFYPAQLVTSLRTSDSLTDNESYFFAELKRLKMIIDRLKNGEELFIILDEILKGTNSVDKQKGSLALMKQLVSMKSCGIIATHDLALGNLEKDFPENIKNYRFEADIKDNTLTFSYQLREGIAENMNACFLMNKMGITV